MPQPYPLTFIIAAAAVVAPLGLAGAAEPPQVFPHDNFQNVVRLPDGKLWRLASRFNAVYYSQSTDNGLTWTGGFTTPFKLFDAPGNLNPQPVVDAAGALHLFIPRRPESGPVEFSIWHYQSNPQRTAWSAGELIHPGNTGSMVKAMHTSTGRLIAPFGDKAVPPPPGHGNNTTLIRYREAGAATFALSPSRLIGPVPAGWNGASDGACEPTVIERQDGALWMLMRSQTGRLLESTSPDMGATWTPAVNSRFHTSTGPPNLVRMDNGDMVLLWNNATMPPRHDGKVWYSGRDVLHAAISQDEGATWKGFREVYLDPFRNQDPPTGDTGTAYPFAATTADGRIIAITGQAAAKAQLRIDPRWLLETNRSDDFTGPDPLRNWSVFKPYGDVVSVKRSRVQGPQLIDDPDPLRTKPVLHVRRPDEKDPDGATWNFPNAARGQTTVRIKLQPGFAGGAVALTDRFLNPTDSSGENNAFYRISINPDGSLPGVAGAAARLAIGQWHDLTIDFKTFARTAVVKLDGANIGTIGAQPGVDVWPGLSYLRLRSTAAGIDANGFLVDAVRHSATRLREAERLHPDLAELGLGGVVSATAGAGDGWTRVRFDDGVPNGNVSAGNASGNGVTATFANPYVATAGTAGIVVESSTGTVTFTDATSASVTSDLLGPKAGERLVLRFVDPADPSAPATVSDVAWRIGSIAADNVDVKLFDVDGEELPDFLFSALPAGINGVIGYSATEDRSAVSLIHAIELTSRSADAWVIGSFAADADLNDFAFRGFAVVPEPTSGVAAAAIAATSLLSNRRRRRRS